MSPDNTKHLVEKYPKIFSRILNPGPPPNMPIYLFSFECSDGWYNIINQLCANIQSHIDWNRKSRLRILRFNRALKQALSGDKSGLIKYHSYRGNVTDITLQSVDQSIKAAVYFDAVEKIPQVVAAQVKEKFGTLRFYYDGGDEVIGGMVRLAESMSSVTCETCGNPGTLQVGGWHYTACATHLKTTL